MACCLFSAKPLFQSMLAYCQGVPTEQISIEFYLKKTKVIIQESAF